MKGNVVSKMTLAVAALVSSVALAISPVPLQGQPGDDSGMFYDIREEITVRGVVSSVLIRPAPGMTAGSHLMVTTVSGTVDASLGRWGLQGSGALSVVLGQAVEVIGVMKTLKGREVLVVRTVKVGDKVFVIRNQYGIPVSPQARQRLAEKGESQ